MPIRGKTAGNKGQGSKWISRTRRLMIYDRDDWKCVWCTVSVCQLQICSAHMATLDHITPRSEGGSNDSSNLITCCMRCNRLRGNEYWHTFALWIARTYLTDKNGYRFCSGHKLRALANDVRKRIRNVMKDGNV